jgi:hypothetical protein
MEGIAVTKNDFKSKMLWAVLADQAIKTGKLDSYPTKYRSDLMLEKGTKIYITVNSVTIDQKTANRL